ncbi:MAG: flagellar basal body P-ring formation protein FlgA [Bacterioplanes sp.]|nr:flagellar basal body P-ring formation protein FlgA [Bacterioplanes sp.]
MTIIITDIKSIVENLKVGSLFAIFFVACNPLFASETNDASLWREVISEQVIHEWRQRSGSQADTSVSFIGVSADYQLPECQHEYEITTPRPIQPGRNGLQISCQAPFWVQHLAIRLEHYSNVIVLAQPANSGDTLSAQHIRQTRLDTGELGKGYYIDKSDVIGQMVRRSLRPGTILSPDMLTVPDIIARGERVSIVLQRPGFQVEMAGTALTSGKLGDRIRVRNETSQRIIAAEVIGTGLVQVQ